MIEINNLKYSYPNSDFHLAVDSLSINDKRKKAVSDPGRFGKNNN